MNFRRFVVLSLNSNTFNLSHTHLHHYSLLRENKVARVEHLVGRRSQVRRLGTSETTQESILNLLAKVMNRRDVLPRHLYSHEAVANVEK